MIDSQGAIRLARFLSEPSNLVGQQLLILNLAGNLIGDMGMEILAPFLELHQQLQVFDVSDN